MPPLEMKEQSTAEPSMTRVVDEIDGNDLEGRIYLLSQYLVPLATSSIVPVCCLYSWPDLVDLNVPDLEDQHLDDGAEFI